MLSTGMIRSGERSPVEFNLKVKKKRNSYLQACSYPTAYFHLAQLSCAFTRSSELAKSQIFQDSNLIFRSTTKAYLTNLARLSPLAMSKFQVSSFPTCPHCLHHLRFSPNPHTCLHVVYSLDSKFLITASIFPFLSTTIGLCFRLDLSR